MNHSPEQTGVLTVLLEDYGKRTLPRIYDIKKMVDDGSTLSSSNIEFLDEALIEAKQFGELVDKDPGFRVFFSRVAHLYNEIITKALDNENMAVVHIPQSTAEIPLHQATS
mgnify:CR=1 FL=1